MSRLTEIRSLDMKWASACSAGFIFVRFWYLQIISRSRDTASSWRSEDCGGASFKSIPVRTSKTCLIDFAFALSERSRKTSKSLAHRSFSQTIQWNPLSVESWQRSIMAQSELHAAARCVAEIFTSAAVCKRQSMTPSNCLTINKCQQLEIAVVHLCSQPAIRTSQILLYFLRTDALRIVTIGNKFGHTFTECAKGILIHRDSSWA